MKGQKNNHKNITRRQLIKINGTTVMLACSLVHEGVESLSFSRIQVMQDSFASFPDDLIIEPCRQCVDPPFVKECPVHALEANLSDWIAVLMNWRQAISWEKNDLKYVPPKESPFTHTVKNRQDWPRPL